MLKTLRWKFDFTKEATGKYQIEEVQAESAKITEKTIAYIADKESRDRVFKQLLTALQCENPQEVIQGVLDDNGISTFNQLSLIFDENIDIEAQQSHRQLVYLLIDLNPEQFNDEFPDFLGGDPDDAFHVEYIAQNISLDINVLQDFSVVVNARKNFYEKIATCVKNHPVEFLHSCPRYAAHMDQQSLMELARSHLQTARYILSQEELREKLSPAQKQEIYITHIRKNLDFSNQILQSSDIKKRVRNSGGRVIKDSLRQNNDNLARIQDELLKTLREKRRLVNERRYYKLILLARFDFDRWKNKTAREASDPGKEKTVEGSQNSSYVTKLEYLSSHIEEDLEGKIRQIEEDISKLEAEYREKLKARNEAISASLLFLLKPDKRFASASKFKQYFVIDPANEAEKALAWQNFLTLEKLAPDYIDLVDSELIEILFALADDADKFLRLLTYLIKYSTLALVHSGILKMAVETTVLDVAADTLSGMAISNIKQQLYAGNCLVKLLRFQENGKYLILRPDEFLTHHLRLDGEHFIKIAPILAERMQADKKRHKEFWYLTRKYEESPVERLKKVVIDRINNYENLSHGEKDELIRVLEHNKIRSWLRLDIEHFRRLLDRSGENDAVCRIIAQDRRVMAAISSDVGPERQYKNPYLLAAKFIHERVEQAAGFTLTHKWKNFVTEYLSGPAHEQAVCFLLSASRRFEKYINTGEYKKRPLGSGRDKGKSAVNEEILKRKSPCFRALLEGRSVKDIACNDPEYFRQFLSAESEEHVLMSEVLREADIPELVELAEKYDSVFKREIYMNLVQKFKEMTDEQLSRFIHENCARSQFNDIIELLASESDLFSRIIENLEQILSEPSLERERKRLLQGILGSDRNRSMLSAEAWFQLLHTEFFSEHVEIPPEKINGLLALPEVGFDFVRKHPGLFLRMDMKNIEAVPHMIDKFFNDQGVLFGGYGGVIDALCSNTAFLQHLIEHLQSEKYQKICGNYPEFVNTFFLKTCNGHIKLTAESLRILLVHKLLKDADTDILQRFYTASEESSFIVGDVFANDAVDAGVIAANISLFRDFLEDEGSRDAVFRKLFASGDRNAMIKKFFVDGYIVEDLKNYFKADFILLLLQAPGDSDIFEKNTELFKDLINQNADTFSLEELLEFLPYPGLSETVGSIINRKQLVPDVLNIAALSEAAIERIMENVILAALFSETYIQAYQPVAFRRLLKYMPDKCFEKAKDNPSLLINLLRALQELPVAPSTKMGKFMGIKTKLLGALKAQKNAITRELGGKDIQWLLSLYRSDEALTGNTLYKELEELIFSNMDFVKALHEVHHEFSAQQKALILEAIAQGRGDAFAEDADSREESIFDALDSFVMYEAPEELRRGLYKNPIAREKFKTFQQAEQIKKLLKFNDEEIVNIVFSEKRILNLLDWRDFHYASSPKLFRKAFELENISVLNALFKDKSAEYLLGFIGGADKELTVKIFACRTRVNSLNMLQKKEVLREVFLRNKHAAEQIIQDEILFNNLDYSKADFMELAQQKEAGAVLRVLAEIKEPAEPVKYFLAYLAVNSPDVAVRELFENYRSRYKAMLLEKYPEIHQEIPPVPKKAGDETMYANIVDIRNKLLDSTDKAEAARLIHFLYLSSKYENAKKDAFVYMDQIGMAAFYLKAWDLSFKYEIFDKIPELLLGILNDTPALLKSSKFDISVIKKCPGMGFLVAYACGDRENFFQIYMGFLKDNAAFAAEFFASSDYVLLEADYAEYWQSDMITALAQNHPLLARFTLIYPWLYAKLSAEELLQIGVVAGLGSNPMEVAEYLQKHSPYSENILKQHRELAGKIEQISREAEAKRSQQQEEQRVRKPVYKSEVVIVKPEPESKEEIRDTESAAAIPSSSFPPPPPPIPVQTQSAPKPPPPPPMPATVTRERTTKLPISKTERSSVPAAPKGPSFFDELREKIHTGKTGLRPSASESQQSRTSTAQTKPRSFEAELASAVLAGASRLKKTPKLSPTEKKLSDQESSGEGTSGPNLQEVLKQEFEKKFGKKCQNSDTESEHSDNEFEEDDECKPKP